jgi:ketosteroid isomerase-like protein
MSESAAGTVRALWEGIQARDWDGARALLADDMVCRWPHSDERFEGGDSFIEMNRAYPEGWEIRVVDVTEIPGGAVSRIVVDQAGTSFHAASFFTVNDGLIEHAVEYWVTEGAEEPPEWRARFSKRPGSEPHQDAAD